MAAFPAPRSVGYDRCIVANALVPKTENSLCVVFEVLMLMIWFLIEGHCAHRVIMVFEIPRLYSFSLPDVASSILFHACTSVVLSFDCTYAHQQ